MPTIFITGGHSGIGLVCATRLAASKNDLILAGRDLERMESVAHGLRTSSGVAVTILELDLSSLASVRTAARRYKDLRASGTVGALDALLVNAGAQFQGPIVSNGDGYEITFATNCLGNFLLTELLLDDIAHGGRIVFTVSGTHDPERMDGKLVGRAVDSDARTLARPESSHDAPRSGGQRYTTSKLCEILYAYELDRKVRRANLPLASIAFDPGFIPETSLSRTSPAFVRWLSRTAPAKRAFAMLGVTMGDLEFSGSALARIATESQFAQKSGSYFQSKDSVFIEARSSKASYDERKAAALWADSEELVHLRPDEVPARLR